MKKKLVSCMLAASMVLSMGSMTVFADTPATTGSTNFDNNTDGEGVADGANQFSTSGDNKATVDEYYSVTKSAGTDDGTLDYYVVVSWSRTHGSATAKGDTYHWDASKQMYERTSQESELSNNTAATVDITVTNYSNAKVKYDISYAAATGYDTTEAADSGSSYSGSLNNYITYNDPNGSTIANESIENSSTEVTAATTGTGDSATVKEGVSSTTGNASYLHEHTAPSAEYKGSVTLNKQATALTNQVVGTYTINITAAPVAKQTVSATVESGKATTLTAMPTPSEDSTKTTSVTFPDSVAELTNGSTAALTVDATALMDAVQDSSFKYSGMADTQNAVGAVDLTLKVNGTEVTEFTDGSGTAVPVTVTTYIAKGLKDFGLSYTKDSTTTKWKLTTDKNNDGSVNATDVTEAETYYYDSETGALTFATTHFSTYVVEASNQAYDENQNTAYATLAGTDGAVAKAGADDTVYLLKDVTGVTSSINLGKNITIDGNGHTLSGTVSSTSNAIGDSTKGSQKARYNGLLEITGEGKTINIKNITVNNSASSAAVNLENSSKNTKVNITDATLYSKQYAICTDFLGDSQTLNMTNVKFNSDCYNALYWKSSNGTITASGCDFASSNPYEGDSNSFTTICVEAPATESVGYGFNEWVENNTLTFTNCTLSASASSTSVQSVIQVRSPYNNQVNFNSCDISTEGTNTNKLVLATQFRKFENYDETNKVYTAASTDLTGSHKNADGSTVTASHIYIDGADTAGMTDVYNIACLVASPCYLYVPTVGGTYSSADKVAMDDGDWGPYYGYFVKNNDNGTYSVNEGVTYTMTGSNANSKVLTSAALLATDSSAVAYTSPVESKTVYAYNGYISETAYATRADASAFVSALNEKGIVPSDSSKGTSGTWRLMRNTKNDASDLTDNDEAYVWFTASGHPANFAGVSYIITNSNDEYDIYIRSSDCIESNKANENKSSTGFVVVWVPGSN